MMTTDERAATDAVRCPFCGARARQACSSRTAYTGQNPVWRRRRKPHKRRMDAWQTAGQARGNQ